MDGRWWILIGWGIASFVLEFFKFIMNLAYDEAFPDRITREELLLYKIWIDFYRATIIGKILLTILVVIWLPITSTINIIWLIAVKSNTRIRKEEEKKYEMSKDKKESY